VPLTQPFIRQGFVPVRYDDAFRAIRERDVAIEPGLQC
jgi:hypothetical protein